MNYILIHGSGHKATSWNETISCMNSDKEILCPNLFSILNGKEASYDNLYASFVEYCNKIDGQINLCGLSLGGILALNYVLDFPDRVNTLVLIGVPHKIPRVMFAVQNIIFRFIPKSIFEKMAFGKKDMFILSNSMKKLDFSDRVQNIKCSTLVICGKKDGINIKSAHYFAENIKNAKLTILENVGHVVNEENPKALAKELNEYYSVYG
ncbi:MAG: alpha/beta hydrolase [Defluviitaleaceae bacterium]|nr:alpha/beta hydrolase [Defluviitaleaceae bacterium]